MTKLPINVVIGNHKSYWGIDFIIDLLIKDLLNGFEWECNNLPKKNFLNLYIEDFSNPSFVEKMTKTPGQHVLVCSEFLTKKRNRVCMNQVSVSRTQLAQDLSVIRKHYKKETKRPTLIFLLERLKSYASIRPLDRYFSRRVRALDSLLKKDFFTFVIQLHPNNGLSTLYENYDAKRVFNYFPIIREDVSSSITTKPRNKIFITSGSQNAYRQLLIRSLNSELANKIQNRNDVISETKNRSRKLFVDLYFRNNSDWLYTSPVRISRSFSDGNVVCLIDNLDNSHPITNVCMSVSGETAIQEIESRIFDYLSTSKINFEIYNRLAHKANSTIVKQLNRFAKSS